jgi:hypothetical protein
MFEEKEEELTAVTERHAATELYVEELRVRVAKLTEREASTEVGFMKQIPFFILSCCCRPTSVTLKSV